MRLVSRQEEDENHFQARPRMNDAAGTSKKRSFIPSKAREAGPKVPDRSPEIRLLEMGFFVPADLNQLDFAIQHILSEAREMGALRGDDSSLQVALREALSNAILHGCHSDPLKSAEVVMDFDDSRGVSIMVRDPGSGFETEPFLMPHSASRARTRGIDLILRNMDRVQFKAHGTEIHMFKRLS